MTPVKKQRHTSGKSQLLEQSVSALHMLGFQIYDSVGQYEKAPVKRPHHVIRNYPSTTIYGTKGRKEALIVAPGPVPEFVSDEDGRVRVLVEAKWQEASGSVDEKMPFVWMSFLESEVRNWIVIMDGAYWRKPRGKAAVEWMQARRAHSARTWHVVNGKGFIHLTTKVWGQERAA